MKRWNGNVMRLSHFHDFYYLEALRANISMAKSANPELNFRRAFVKLDEDVNATFDTLCERMALHIYVYLWVAALGEATFADEMCEQRIAEQHSSGWSEREALEYFPNDDNVAVLKAIYEQDWNGGGYGGDAWYDIVEGMEMYGKVSNATFIDHAVDLEHNGGNVFDKTNGGVCGLECYAGYDRSDLSMFLDVKFKNDILNSVRYSSWTSHDLDIAVSPKVYNLVLRYHNIVENVKAVDFLNPSLEWLSEYSVDWDYGELTLEDAQGGYECAWCSNKIDIEWCHNFDDENICDECYERKVTTCDKCNEDCLADDTEEVKSGNHTEEWCGSCQSAYAVNCEHCAELVDEEYNTIRTEDDYTVCNDCAEEMECHECDEYHYDLVYHNSVYHVEEDETIELPVDADGIFTPFAMEVA